MNKSKLFVLTVLSILLVSLSGCVVGGYRGHGHGHYHWRGDRITFPIGR